MKYTPIVSVCFRHQLFLLWFNLGIPSHQYPSTIWFPLVPIVRYVSCNVGYVSGQSIFNPCVSLIKIGFSTRNLAFPSALSILIVPSAPFWYSFTVYYVFLTFICSYFILFCHSYIIVPLCLVYRACVSRLVIVRACHMFGVFVPYVLFCFHLFICWYFISLSTPITLLVYATCSFFSNECKVIFRGVTPCWTPIRHAKL